MTNETGQNMKHLQVLHLEDDRFDAELIQCQLHDHRIPCSVTRVDTREAFEAALQGAGFDIILSDSKLPGFDTIKALAMARDKCHGVPFVFVSGASSPKTKTDALSLGAADFINKDELPRLTCLVNWLFAQGERKPRVPVLPEAGKPVTVQCKSYRCLGYLDRQGVWRDFQSSVALTEVTDWSEL